MFGRRKKKIENTNQDLLNQFNNINTKISDTKNKYKSSILSSLQNDEELYIKYLESDDDPNTTFWTLSIGGYNSITMRKHGWRMGRNQSGKIVNDFE
jgi:hypothetical protein